MLASIPHFPGKARLLHALCPKHGEREASLFGYEITLDLVDYMQRSMYLGTFEPEETRLLRSHLKPGQLFVDVGANVGYYTLLASSRGCRVTAFEPSPFLFRLLNATIERNHLPEVALVNAALGDVSGEHLLYLSTLAGLNSPTMVENPDSATITVPMLRLQDEVTEPIDLLKIDVEGFEPNVLRGARHSDIRAILCEFNDIWLKRNGTTSRELYESLLHEGYVPHKELDGACALQNILFTLQR